MNSFNGVCGFHPLVHSFCDRTGLWAKHESVANKLYKLVFTSTHCYCVSCECIAHQTNSSKLQCFERVAVVPFKALLKRGGRRRLGRYHGQHNLNYYNNWEGTMVSTTLTTTITLIVIQCTCTSIDKSNSFWFMFTNHIHTKHYYFPNSVIR